MPSGRGSFRSALAVFPLHQYQVADLVWTGDALELFGGVHRSGCGDGQVTDSNDTSKKALVDVNGPDVADEKFPEAFREHAALDGQSARINSQDDRGPPPHGNHRGNNQPEEKKVPEIPPP